MAHKSFSSEGVILLRKNYGEADRLLTIFSKYYGKVFLIAKGVRKPKSRKRGHIEIFSRIKFSCSKNDHFVLMNEAELIDSYEEIRKNLKKTALAYYFIEVISKIIQEDERHDDLYILLLKYFELLKISKELKRLRLNFIEDVLITMGYWPKEKKLINHDNVLEKILERQINSKRVGEKILKV